MISHLLLYLWLWLLRRIVILLRLWLALLVLLRTGDKMLLIDLLIAMYLALLVKGLLVLKLCSVDRWVLVALRNSLLHR